MVQRDLDGRVQAVQDLADPLGFFRALHVREDSPVIARGRGRESLGVRRTGWAWQNRVARARRWRAGWMCGMEDREEEV